MRCLFKCDSVWEHINQYTYTLSAVYGNSVNQAFWEATPSGNFTATVTKAKGKLFEVGREYYIDINEVKPVENQTSPQQQGA